MENKVFKVVLLQALPASGKSEVRNFMANVEPERLQNEFHIGENLQLDDFPYVHMMRRIDNELQAMGQPRIFYPGEELDDTRSLSLCMNNYRASGAGGYGVYTECGVLREQPTEIAELIIDYVLRHKDITVDKTKWLNIIY